MNATRTYTSVALLVVALASTACDETVTPILESDRQATIFTTLDMNADTQFVRVIPVRQTIDPNADADRGVDVRSIDLTNSEVVTWSDSSITFDNDVMARVFFAPLRVRPTHTYRIEVRLDGSELVTSAETTIPPIPEADVGEEFVQRTISPAGFQIIGRQELRWSGLSDMPIDVEMWYRFLRTPSAPFKDFQVRLLNPPVFSADEMQVEFDLNADRLLLADSTQKMAFIGMGMTITILDSEFKPPGGEFDPEILVQPGTFSNVENGFGFVGAVGRFSVEWTLREESVRDLGYLTVEDAFGKHASGIRTAVAVGSR